MTIGYALFPDDERMASLYYIRASWPAKLSRMESEAPVTLPARVVAALLSGPDDARLAELAKPRAIDGATVGVMLMAMWVMSLRGIVPSANRAAALIEVAHSKKQGHSVGMPLRTDRADAMKAWARMRSVAHLHAGIQSARGAAATITTKIDRPIDPDKLNGATLTLALGQSHSFLSFGAEVVAKNTKQKKPALDLNTAWVLPPRFDPMPLGDDLAQVHSWLLDAMDHYKGEARR